VVENERNAPLPLVYAECQEYAVESEFKRD